MGNYSIREVEHLSGVKAHTLRIWEQRYDIITPKRTGTNIRYYTDMDLKLILKISLLNKNGHRIGMISKMTILEIENLVKSLETSDLKFDWQVNSLATAMIEMDEARFEKIMSTNIIQHGFEKTMMKIIYPFLTKIGIMWVTGNINPAQEHFITNLIRQKIIVAIDGQIVNITPNTKKYLLFLPEGEHHELSLLFLSYLLQSRNNRVVYLGSNVPLKDMLAVHEYAQPDFIYAIFTCSPTGITVKKYIQNLSKVLKKTKLVFSGQRVKNLNMEAASNVLLLKSDKEILDFVEKGSTNNSIEKVHNISKFSESFSINDYQDVPTKIIL